MDVTNKVYSTTRSRNPALRRVREMQLLIHERTNNFNKFREKNFFLKVKWVNNAFNFFVFDFVKLKAIVDYLLVLNFSKITFTIFVVMHCTWRLDQLTHTWIDGVYCVLDIRPQYVDSSFRWLKYFIEHDPVYSLIPKQEQYTVSE